jgi:hypothetical protein
MDEDEIAELERENIVPVFDEVRHGHA